MKAAISASASLLASLFLLSESTSTFRKETSDSFKPLTLSYEDLRGSSSQHKLMDALVEDGLVAINEIPGYESLRLAALTGTVQCAESDDTVVSRIRMCINGKHGILRNHLTNNNI